MFVAVETYASSVFVVEDDAFGDLRLKVLRNTHTAEEIGVVYDMGGRVEQLRLIDPATKALRDVRSEHTRRGANNRTRRVSGWFNQGRNASDRETCKVEGNWRSGDVRNAKG